MPTKVKSRRTGETIYLENSAERGDRYARELKQRSKLRTGEVLTPTQAAFRMGVLNERKVNAKIYNKKNGLPGKAKKRSKSLY